MKKPLKIPKFKNEDDERDFLAKINLSDYFDRSDGVHISFPDLKPTSRSISIRLPEYIIDQIKIQANKLDIPYQTLMKQYIAQGAMRK